MKLSIVTINYNNAAGLRKTLASVAEQTYRDIEHIIVDGGSSDESIEVIKDYVSKVNREKVKGKNVIWISEPDKGIYNAMNKGIEIALGKRVVNSFNRSELVEDKYGKADRPKQSGVENKELSDYIQILNSGDLLAAPDVTERMMDALAKAIDDRCIDDRCTGGVPIFYGNMLKSYDGKKIIRDTCGNGMYTPESFLYFYKGTLNHDCAYIRRDLFEKFGLYNEEMKICSDWEWYVRAIVLGHTRAIYTDIDVTVFDMNGISESNGKNAELIKQERRAYLEKILPPAVLHDYDAFSFPIQQYQRLNKYHLWELVYFMERVLFKLEKWRILRK